MRKSRTKFFVGLAIVLVVLVTSVISGYFVIDRVLVPKYFGQYGINNLSGLVDVAETIYTVPAEKDFILNPHTDFDRENATSKLISAGFPTLSTGIIDYESIAKNDFTFTPDEDYEDSFVLLSDKEVAAIAGEIIDSGILVSNFPDLSYINSLNIEVKQLIIKPDEETMIPNENRYDEDLPENSAESQIVGTTDDATITLTIKLDAESARQQISTNLNMPMFLVDWIIPDTIYVTSELHTKIDPESGTRIYENATLAINSKTAKQSEVLLKLLISFIFPDGTYTIESLANELGALAIEGINVLGNLQFAKLEVSKNLTLSGIKLDI